MEFPIHTPPSPPTVRRGGEYFLIMPKNTVFIVGAGPGDPGLITKRGLDLINSADVIVMDALVNPALLRGNARAQIIDVGKRGPGAPGGHKRVFPQEKINQLLVKWGRTGQRVVRLKGGDPFVFGRGGEEVDALAKAGILYEIVPGITAAIAGPTYAGIPVTDRRWSSQVTFITGHEGAKETDGIGVDWQNLSPQGTLVIFMGVSQWPDIRKTLLNYGWPADHPVCAIASATLPEQRVLSTTIKESENYFKIKKLTAPAVIVVGHVASLAHVRGWVHKTKPLLGKKIVVTRPLEQNQTLVRMLEDLGADVIECPAIKINPKSEILNPKSDWLVFLSANAVRTFTGSIPAKTKICVVGPATKRAVLEKGWVVHKMAQEFNSRGVLKALGSVKGKKILIPRVQGGPQDMGRALRKRGAFVEEVVTYETVGALPPPPHVKRLIIGGVDAITFTSASTVRHFCGFFTRAELRKIFSKAIAVSIGPSTTKALREFGITRLRQSNQATSESLVTAIK